jgi:hypothetical protein
MPYAWGWAQTRVAWSITGGVTMEQLKDSGPDVVIDANSVVTVRAPQADAKPAASPTSPTAPAAAGKPLPQSLSAGMMSVLLETQARRGRA